MECSRSTISIIKDITLALQRMCPFPISNIELSCISIASNIENNISYPFSPNTSNLLHAFLYVFRIHHFFFHRNFSPRFQFKYYYKGHLNKINQWHYTKRSIIPTTAEFFCMETSSKGSPYSKKTNFGPT